MQTEPNKAALTNPLPLRSRSWRIGSNPKQNRSGVLSSGWQASIVGQKMRNFQHLTFFQIFLEYSRGRY